MKFQAPFNADNSDFSPNLPKVIIEEINIVLEETEELVSAGSINNKFYNDI